MQVRTWRVVGAALIDGIYGMLQAGGPALAALAGVAIGAQHALEPDHVAAMATRVCSNEAKPRRLRRIITQTSLYSALWGAGHTSGIFAVGILVAIFSLGISDLFFSGMEIMAGMMLILLGIFAVLRKRHLHIHPHRHADGTVHTHAHGHDHLHLHRHTAYVIGCIHGLAGSGALVALLASGLGGAEAAVYFLAAFGAGSMAGMMMAGGIIGVPLVFFERVRRLQAVLRITVALAGIILGTIVLVGGISHWAV